jgi:hypothetical protein
MEKDKRMAAPAGFVVLSAGGETGCSLFLRVRLLA